VLAAARDLVWHAASLRRDEAAACIADAKQLLRAIAAPRVGAEWSALHRMEVVLPVRHLFDDDLRLRDGYADQLIAHGKLDLARVELIAMEHHPTFGRQARRRLDELSAEHRLGPACARPY
ncbi:MAG: hypothetical protein KIT31_43540, partial [Deltaproteobacteria bacterium]|nr:hypothetical protein [Deltaproteobacteria bacterium]